MDTLTIDTATPELIYPHIVRNHKGEPYILGTNTKVQAVAFYFKSGMSAEEICDALSHCTAAEIHSAIAYYLDFEEEIEMLLATERALFTELKRQYESSSLDTIMA